MPGVSAVPRHCIIISCPWLPGHVHGLTCTASVPDPWHVARPAQQPTCQDVDHPPSCGSVLGTCKCDPNDDGSFVCVNGQCKVSAHAMIWHGCRYLEMGAGCVPWLQAPQSSWRLALCAPFQCYYAPRAARARSQTLPPPVRRPLNLRLPICLQAACAIGDTCDNTCACAGTCDSNNKCTVSWGRKWAQ